VSVVRASEIVEASPEEVWEVIADPRNLPRWNQHIKRVKGVPEDGLKKGSRYTTSLRVVGVPFDVHAEVVKMDPPRYAEIRLTGPLEAVVRTWVHPAGKRRSRLEHEVTYRVKRIGPPGRIIDQGLRMIGAGTLLRRGTRAQKRQIERG
jgi:uncharacterized protein YndB with AHSA1/START domain